MEEIDKGYLMTRIYVSGWMFLLVLAQPVHVTLNAKFPLFIYISFDLCFNLTLAIS